MPDGPVKRRPQGWGPAWFLAQVVAQPDVGQQELYRRWAQEWGVRVEHLVAEIRGWRRSVPGFKDALETLRPAAKTGRAGASETEPTWQERFVELYRVTHNRRKTWEAMGGDEWAANGGLAWSGLRKLWAPASNSYDQHFSDMLADADAEIIEMARGGVRSGMEVLQEAVEAGDVRAADSLVKQGVNILERREPRDWSRQQVNVHQGTIFHAPAEARRQALAGALAASRQVIETTQQAALPAAPEPIALDVVEAELVDAPL